ncbi:MAG: SufD family Fe-S cluster assembly protein [Candidatus Shapirobacteria bacterium]
MKNIIKYLVKKGESVVWDEVMIYDKNNLEGETEIRAVVEDGGNLILKGKILIQKDAVGANAFLRFKVLLLGLTSRAEVDPELEILTNDVKASHAASVGQVDSEQLFYLMSRGFNKQKAIELIVESFLN